MYGTVTDPRLKVLGAPREYIQGPGALDQIPHLAKRYGSGHLFCAIDPMLLDRIGPRLREGFAAAGGRLTLEPFGGECTEAEADRLALLAAGADVVAGIGGGKCIDIGKFVGLKLGLPVWAVPTIASNDAPTSRLIVLYNDEHVVVGTRFMAFNPDVVLVDTDIVRAAPPRFLRAGIGDALTKFFEARSAAAGTGTNSFSARPPIVATRLGRICLDVLLTHGPSCLDALASGQDCEGFEELVEALIYLSGITFESGGLSVAHSMIRGMTRIPRIATFLHGEQVAYGVLVQLVLDGDDAWLQQVMTFSRRVGLPVSLRDFDIDGPECDQAIEVIAQGTLTAPYLRNFPRPLSAADLAGAMHRLEDLAARAGQGE